MRKVIKKSIDNSEIREGNRTMSSNEDIGRQVLDVAMEANDSGATTIRGYLCALAAAVWNEGEGFSGKRPFGNSCWDTDVYAALAKAGLIEGMFDEDGYLDEADWDKGRELVNVAIKALPEQGDNPTREEDEVRAELARQDERWGEQNHPDGTGLTGDHYGADHARKVCQQAAAGGTLAWRHILREEVNEAFAEDDPDKLLTELLQVEAVARQWRMAIRRRLASENGGEVSAQ